MKDGKIEEHDKNNSQTVITTNTTSENIFRYWWDRFCDFTQRCQCYLL